MKDKIDRTVLGALGGLLGGLAMVIFLQLSKIVVKGGHPKLMHIAHLFIPPGPDHTFWGGIIAHLGHFVISSMLGIVFIFLFRMTGRDWATTKGLLFGGATWVVINGILGKILEIPMQASIPVAFVMFFGHLVYGITTSWATAWLSERAKL